MSRVFKHILARVWNLHFPMTGGVLVGIVRISIALRLEGSLEAPRSIAMSLS